MKILVLGGYGIFGGRLCELLAPNAQLTLLVGGRSLDKAQAFCEGLKGLASLQAIAFDRDKDISPQLGHLKPDLVIDATGPFQLYGNAPYTVVEACLSHGIHYMDFADGSDFVKGINRFDQQAKQKNIFMLSGVSSFPVLTAAVVRRLSKNMDSIISIKGGIAPSPFAGVGLNVIKAIAAYAGQKVVLRRNGNASHGYGLTEIMRYTISPPGRMPLHNIRFSLVDVPDLQLLPDIWPQLDSIWMGAGPVPEVLHRMLNALSWLVRWRLLPSLTPFARLFFHAINILRWGEHRGGMFVEITGTQNRILLTSSWHLLAEGKDGPYIPCMAIQSIVLQLLAGKIPVAGARAASMDLELEDYDALFIDKTIYTGERHDHEQAEPYMFQTILGSVWTALPAPVKKLHSVDSFLHATGVATVVRGTNWLASLVAKVFRFPAPGQNIPIKVGIKRSIEGEKWTRTFGTRSFTSHLSLGKGLSERLMVERFGPFSFGLALVQEEGKLRFVTRLWSLWKIPLPSLFLPGGDSYEFEENGRFNFHVEIGLPLIGLIVRYSGWLVSVNESAWVDRSH